MSLIKKFAWANTGTFTLTGSPYVGFYNVQDNVAYAGISTQDIELTNVDKIYTNILVSDLFLNRLPTQNFSLTYSLSDFVFQPNEFINSNSVDNKLYKLYINYLDTYRACFMASSKLPYNNPGVQRAEPIYKGYFPTYSPTNNFTYPTPLSAINPAITRNSKIAYIPNQFSNNNTFIFATSGSLIVYNVDQFSTFTLVFSSSYIETNTSNYGSLTFGNITNITYNGTNLYVCDNGNTSIYSYDISSVLQQDRALGYKFNLTNSTNDTQGQLINPVLIGSSNDTIYVYDASLYTIFFYDLNYNLINSYKNQILFTSSKPVSLTYYQLYNQLYVLTEDFKVIILDSQANPVIIQLDTSGLVTNEKARKLIFSSTNSDVLYLLSNFNLYKKFVSNIVYNIGAYSFVNNITGNNIDVYTTNLLYDISIISPPRNDPTDYIAMYGFDQIVYYNELLTYNAIVK
jgi:hypothetical protein